MGLRLDWEPSGDSGHDRTSEPPFAAWRTDRRGRSGIVLNHAAMEPVEYNAQLLGAEIHWWRTQVARIASWKTKEPSPGAWHALEHGITPRADSESPLLSTLVAVGRHAGLRLVWEEADAPWRVRPWQRGREYIRR